jgi:hypothetical protein
LLTGGSQSPIRRLPLLLSLGIAVTLAAAALAATPDAIVAQLNHQRVTNGIPGGIVLNSAWTTGCEHHIRYEELNGIPWTHVETPGKPGFTKDGQLAGITGDQQHGLGTFDSTDPFENLPLHLANLLNPSLHEIGAYERGGRSCVVVQGGAPRTITANHLYVYPGPNRTGVAPSQRVHGEYPGAPGDVVGLPQGTTTGPTIYLFAAGPWQTELPLKLASAHVAGPDGPVAIRVVDPRLHARIAPYVPLGVFFLIPVSPLRAGATYRVTATVHGAKGTSLTQGWHFRTA